MYERYRELMFRSLDAKLTQDESNELQMGFLQYPELKVEMNQLMQIRKMLSGLPDPGFLEDFTGKVINKVKQENFSFALFLNTFKKITIAAAVALFVLMGANMVKSGNYSLKGALAIEEQSLEQLMTNETLVYLE